MRPQRVCNAIHLVAILPVPTTIATEGYVTSDCDADADVYATHHYLNHSKVEIVADVLRAGTDVDCGPFVSDNAWDALGNGTITELDIDERLRVQFTVRFQLGHFDPIGPLQSISDHTQICSADHISISFDGVTQSATLVKNIKSTLPLQKGKSAAVIGPNANLSKVDAGYYGPHFVCNMTFWTLVDAVSQSAGSVVSDVGTSRELAVCCLLEQSFDDVPRTLGSHVVEQE